MDLVLEYFILVIYWFFILYWILITADVHMNELLALNYLDGESLPRIDIFALLDFAVTTNTEGLSELVLVDLSFASRRPRGCQLACPHHHGLAHACFVDRIA